MLRCSNLCNVRYLDPEAGCEFTPLGGIFRQIASSSSALPEPAFHQSCHLQKVPSKCLPPTAGDATFANEIA